MPGPLLSSEIRGGKWNLSTLRGSFSGKVINGSIFNKGDNTFIVTVRLRVQKGGNGDAIATGVLDHTEFPPTFDGFLLQP